MRVELAPDVQKRLCRALRQARRREVGGMLFAQQLAPGHFQLIDFSIDSSSGSHTSFRRDHGLHQQALDRFFESTGRDYQRFNYLGEWHSHPSFSVRPSLEDIATMTDLVEDPHLPISFAVLLVLRLRLGFWMDYSLTGFARNCAPQRLKIAHRIIWI